MFNKEELQVLQTFLSRVDLKGTEAQNHVYLTQKINALISEAEAEAPEEESEPEPLPEEDDEDETDS